jgi:hypothetical protein
VDARHCVEVGYRFEVPDYYVILHFSRFLPSAVDQLVRAVALNNDDKVLRAGATAI